MVFLGIESPNDEALLSTSKGQNTSKEEDAGSYLLRAIRKIQSRRDGSHRWIYYWA